MIKYPRIYKYVSVRNAVECKWLQCLLILLLWLLPAGFAYAGCRWMAADRTIWITDYPAGAPCSLTTLLRQDRMNGWGVVAYDAASDVYTVNASLLIGANAGPSTYFQIGSPAHQSETLVLNGNLTIHPACVKDENPVREFQSQARINRVRLGCPDDPAVRAALKFACTPSNAWTLISGVKPGRPPEFSWSGSELHVYNSQITAAIPDNQHVFGGKMDTRWRHGDHVFTYGGLVFQNAEISWFRGVATWGARNIFTRIENTVFANGHYAMINGGWPARGCTFRNLVTAVGDWGGPIVATLTGCRFASNRCNWKLTVPGSCLTAVDCDWDRPLGKNRYAWDPSKTDKRKRPAFISQRHVIVAAADPAGRPVARAEVEIACEQDEWYNPIICGKASTDPAGRTPGPGMPGALLLVEFVEHATATPDMPERTVYTYRLSVSAKGYAPAVLADFTPTQSWQQAAVVLKPMAE